MLPGQNSSCIFKINLNYIILDCDIECSWALCQSHFIWRNPLMCLWNVCSPHSLFSFSFFHTFTSFFLFLVFLICHLTACLPSPLFLPLSFPPSFPCSWPPTICFCEHKDEKDAFSSCLFQILPPQPLTSCLSLTSCALRPSVSFAISNFIYLPMLLLCFIPRSLFLLIMSSPLTLFTPLPSSPILL